MLHTVANVRCCSCYAQVDKKLHLQSFSKEEPSTGSALFSGFDAAQGEQALQLQDHVEKQTFSDAAGCRQD